MSQISVTPVIIQERRSPSTNSKSSVLVHDILSISEIDGMSNDEDSHGLPSDKEVREKDKNKADIEFQSSFKKWKK